MVAAVVAGTIVARAVMVAAVVAGTIVARAVLIAATVISRATHLFLTVFVIIVLLAPAGFEAFGHKSGAKNQGCCCSDNFPHGFNSFYLFRCFK